MKRQTSHSKVLLIQFLQGKKDGAGKTENVDQVAKEEEQERSDVPDNQDQQDRSNVYTMRISYN